MGWNNCNRFVVSNSFTQILRTCRKVEPEVTPMLELLVKILKASEAGRAWNTWSWVLRNSLASAGEDATTVWVEPSRRYTSGPYCSAKRANVMWGDFPNMNKLPTTGHGHGPGGSFWDFLKPKLWRTTTKSINNKKGVIRSPKLSCNLPCNCNRWNIDMTPIVALAKDCCSTLRTAKALLY